MLVAIYCTFAHVMNAFKNNLEDIGMNFEAFSAVKNLWMCRKCFSAYERYQNLQKIMLDDLSQAMSIILPLEKEST